MSMHNNDPMFDTVVVTMLDNMQEVIDEFEVCPRCLAGSLVVSIVANLARDGTLDCTDLEQLIECVQHLKAAITPPEKMN